MEARIFKTKTKDGKEVVLRFNRPNQTLISKGDFTYREFFSKAIRTGILTNAEANKLLKERGVWTGVEENRFMELKIEINKLEQEFEGKNKDEGLITYAEIKKLRSELEDLESLRSSVVNNTAESVASEMRTQFFASECVVYNDSGKKVFKDLTDLMQRMDEPLALDSYRQALISNFENLLGIKMPDEVDSTLTEDKWLNSLVEQKQEEMAEEEVVEEEKPAKKRGRKKATTTE